MAYYEAPSIIGGGTLPKARDPKTLNGRVLRGSYVAPSRLRLKEARDAADKRIIMRVAAVLEREWPGHFFMVQCDHDQRLLKINLPPLLTEPHWYLIPLTVIYSDPGLKTVVRAAGEILDRYRLPTTRWGSDEYRAAVRAQPIHAHRRKGYKVPS